MPQTIADYVRPKGGRFPRDDYQFEKESFSSKDFAASLEIALMKHAKEIRVSMEPGSSSTAAVETAIPH